MPAAAEVERQPRLPPEKKGHRELRPGAPLTVFSEDGTELPEVDVLWESSDENIVVVGPDGEATAVAEGTATITATAGEAYATADVTVAMDG